MKLSFDLLPPLRRGFSISKYLGLFLWVGAVVLFPFTSLPLLIDLSSATTVAPPSLVFFFVLALFWFIPYILRRGQLPVEVIPLLGLAAVLLAASAASSFINIPPWRDASFLSETAEALLTFCIGAVVFFVTATWLSSKRGYFRLTVQLINWSGLFIIAWSLLQGIYAFGYDSVYPSWLLDMQKTVVGRSMPLFVSRVSGFTYEPSWLAHQLNLVYLPIWIAATLTGYSAHARRLWLISFENILLLGGLVVLFMSFSRVGWVSLMLVAIYLSFQFTRRLISAVKSRLTLHDVPRSLRRNAIHVLISAGMWLMIMLVYASVAVGLVYLGAKVEPRLQRIVQENLLASESVFHAANKLQFAERVVYWGTGWEIFGKYPILGVGPGNAGFFFFEKMPAFGWALTEVTDTFYRYSSIPNTKSMWIRLLAETGLVGFGVFLSWYYLLWQAGHLARSSPDHLLRMSGLAGHLVLISFIIEGFSIDSFALPYYWFSVGLLSAGAYLARKDTGQVVQSERDTYG
jgi:hypothetical protein